MKNKSMLTKILIPLSGVFISIVLFFAWLIPSSLRSNTIETTVVSGIDLIRQYKIFRAYYTGNVVKKVVNETDMEVTFAHKTIANSIPFPATMIHDFSELLSEQDGVKLKLYSPFPFPNRSSRKLDEFGQEAWDIMQKDPKANLIRTDTIDGNEFLRIGVADPLTAPGCVACHNTRPDTPKTDWKLGDVRGVMEVMIPMEAQFAGSRDFALTASLSLALIGLLTLFILAYVIKRILQPLKEAVDVTHQFEKGNLEIEFQANTKDETGTLLTSLQKVVISLKKIIGDVRSSTKSTVNASQKMIRSTDRIFQQTKDSKLLADSATTSTTSISNHARSMASSAKQTSANVETVTTSIEQLSSNVNTVASAAEEMSTNMKGISTNANKVSDDVKKMVISIDSMSTALNQTSKSTQQAQQISADAQNSTQKMLEVMNQLQEGASQIGNVVKLIDSITSQTNMLALNATIEAASAGDAGKGFAVVASEVKELANQTTDANNQIGHQITTIQGHINNAMEHTNNVNGIIANVANISSSIDGEVVKQRQVSSEVKQSIGEIASASQETAHNVEEATKGLQEITQSAAEASQSSKLAVTNLSEANKGVREVAESTSEILYGVDTVSDNVQKVQNSLQEINNELSLSHQEMQQLVDTANTLLQLVDFFKIRQKNNLKQLS